MTFMFIAFHSPLSLNSLLVDLKTWCVPFLDCWNHRWQSNISLKSSSPQPVKYVRAWLGGPEFQIWYADTRLARRRSYLDVNMRKSQPLWPSKFGRERVFRSNLVQTCSLTSLLNFWLQRVSPCLNPISVYIISSKWLSNVVGGCFNRFSGTCRVRALEFCFASSPLNELGRKDITIASFLIFE